MYRCVLPHLHYHDVLVIRFAYLCGHADNAVMIAWASMHRFLAGDFDPYSIAIRPKWSIEELSS